MKVREPRQKVLIKARMRVGATWSDACILNLSTRGMLVQSGRAPQRGNYLEIRRGSHVVIARVVWSKEQRFGVQTQDPVQAEDLVRATGNCSAPTGASTAKHERRSAPRPIAAPHESSRVLARRVEFAALLAFGAASACLLFTTLDELLARPLTTLESALAGKPGG